MSGRMKNGMISDRSKKILETYYYERGYTFGRDALHHLLQKRLPDTHPSKEEIELWLKNQRLHQLYKRQRKGGQTNRFHPTKPWRHTSIDLIDFNFKQDGSMRYIIVFVDNFSRFMITQAVTGKTAKKVAKGFEKILAKWKDEFPNDEIESVVADDGGEFKGAFIKVLEEFDIKKRKILGGHPQQNGLVERSNGKLKSLLAKNRVIRGGGWGSHLELTTQRYNDQYNRGIDESPATAVKFKTKGELKKVKAHNKKEYKVKSDAKARTRDLKPKANVRLALSKGVLSKSSAPQWTDKIYQIESKIDARGSMAAKYTIKGRDQGFKYTRNDLQLVNVDDLEDIPERLKKKKSDDQRAANSKGLRNRDVPVGNSLGLRNRDVVVGGFTGAALVQKEREDDEKKRKKAQQKADELTMYNGVKVKLPFTKSSRDRGKIVEGKLMPVAKRFYRVEFKDKFVAKRGKNKGNWYNLVDTKRLIEAYKQRKAKKAKS